MPKQLPCPDSGKKVTSHPHVLTAKCSACGKWVRLRKDGCLMKHAPLATNNERLKQTAEAIKKWKEGNR